MDVFMTRFKYYTLYYIFAIEYKFRYFYHVIMLYDV